jgi:hypothetical protein
MSDPIIQRIERFRCVRGQLSAKRRNRGYTLYHANSGTQVARLRPTGRGPFGRTVLPLDEALQFIAAEDIFWASV